MVKHVWNRDFLVHLIDYNISVLYFVSLFEPLNERPLLQRHFIACHNSMKGLSKALFSAEGQNL